MDVPPEYVVDAACDAAPRHGMSASSFRLSVRAVASTIYGWSVVYDTAFATGHVDVERDSFEVMPTSVWDPVESRSGHRIMAGLIAFIVMSFAGGSTMRGVLIGLAVTHAVGIVMLPRRARFTFANVVLLLVLLGGAVIDSNG